VSFHSMQADWQALQPMHFDTSISLATSVRRRSGCGTSAVADILMTSPGRRFDGRGWTGGFAAAVTGSGARSLMTRLPLRPVRY
jgi:hypothetical protein